MNVGEVERLIEVGRMRSAGRHQIELAKADGRWEAAYTAQSEAEVTPDLRAALDASPTASDSFESSAAATATRSFSTSRRP